MRAGAEAVVWHDGQCTGSRGRAGQPRPYRRVRRVSRVMEGGGDCASWVGEVAPRRHLRMPHSSCFKHVTITYEESSILRCEHGPPLKPVPVLCRGQV